MRHFISLENHSADVLNAILKRASALKSARGNRSFRPLDGQTWALIFSKSSTRTRVSFEVGIRELGGQAMFLNAKDLQLGRGEPIRDTARVLGRMVSGAIIRTASHDEIVDFARLSQIPTINALSDHAHPCQIMSDILTICEKLGSIQNRIVTFIGDGTCNVATSWIYASQKFGFELRIASPKKFAPAASILRDFANVKITSDVSAAAESADVLYTDVWISMGKEAEAEARARAFAGFQINSAIVKKAKNSALVMHCLPAYRGCEITNEMLEAHAKTIFDQAENRLHTQKAILCWLMNS